MNDLLDQFNMLNEYWDFSNRMEKVLHDVYKENLEKLVLPIDIKFVAENLGFDIYRSNLSFPSQVYGWLQEKTISLSPNITYKEQQWVVAQGIAMHHLGLGGAINNPFFIKNNIDTVSVDIMSILLLLPIFLFQKDLSEYMANTDHFIGSQYLEHLCNRSQIPMPQLCFGYYIINLMLCFQRQIDFKNSGYDVMAFQEKDEKNEFINIYL